MRNGFLFLSFTLLLTCSIAALSQEKCTFDQAAVAKSFATVAARNPGAILLPEEKAYAWHPASGETIVVRHGGCVDLGTTVEVKFRRAANLTKGQAVARLLEVVSKYWSPQSAEGLRIAWAKQSFEQQASTNNAVEYSTPKAEHFPLGFTITFSSTSVAVSWAEL